jgi:hypothetical protein
LHHLPAIFENFIKAEIKKKFREKTQSTVFCIELNIRLCSTLSHKIPESALVSLTPLQMPNDNPQLGIFFIKCSKNAHQASHPQL